MGANDGCLESGTVGSGDKRRDGGAHAQLPTPLDGTTQMLATPDGSPHMTCSATSRPSGETAGCDCMVVVGGTTTGACYFLVGTSGTCDPTDCVPSEGAADADCSGKEGYYCAATCATPSECSCPNPAAGCGVSSTCCRPGGITGAPDPACLELCRATELTCFAPDLEGATATITASTAAGCSGTTTLAVNGSVDWTLDCTLRRVCIDESRYARGGCLGTRGTCYPATLEPRSFGYHLRACITGGLSCSVK